MRHLNTQHSPTKVALLPQKEGEVCIYITKLGRGEERKIRSKWAVRRSLGDSQEMCLLQKGKVFHEVKIKDMWVVIVNPALIFVCLQMKGCEARDLLFPCSISCVLRRLQKLWDSPKEQGILNCCVMWRPKNLKEYLIWDMLQFL